MSDQTAQDTAEDRLLAEDLRSYEELIGSFAKQQKVGYARALIVAGAVMVLLLLLGR